MLSSNQPRRIIHHRMAEERANEIAELRAIIESQRTIIKEKDLTIAERDARLAELERAAADLQASRKAIRFTAKVIMMAIKVHAVQLLRPRLGVLHQYPPRSLRNPPGYSFPAGAGKAPKISIVTPSFNHGMYLERTIRSVIDQNYPNLEYIVQDGGSHDGSAEILKKYADSLRHWESAKDNGQSHAINLGFRHATGEIMAYLNSDDFLLPGTLPYIADYFRRHPEIDVVYGHRIVVDAEDREVGRWVLPPHNDEVLSSVDYIPQETLFWRRRIWDKVGGQVDESFQFAMDWDLLIRFRDAGARFVRLPRFLAAFRVHPSQKTSAQIEDLGAREIYRLRRRCHGRNVTHVEAMNAAAFYMVRHILYDRLSRLSMFLGL